MNFASYEIVFLDKLLKSYNNKSNRIKKSSETIKGYREVLVGNLEIRANANSLPFFCFNDSNICIKCQLLNFNECWLNNVLYTDNWTLIQYDSKSFYIEIYSFSILNENNGLLKIYNDRYKENLNILLSKIKERPVNNEYRNLTILLKEFETKTLPLLNQSFSLDNFKDGITIVGIVKSKSCIQLMKIGKETIFFFIVELMIENTSNTCNTHNDNNYLTTFVIFQMQEIDEIMIYYHILLVKHKYIFQNLFLHTLKFKKQNELLTKSVFEFVLKKSFIQRCFVQNFNSNSTPNVLKRYINELTQGDFIFEFEQLKNIKKEISLNFYHRKTISYSGCITKIINNNYALYEIDHQYLLCLSHYPIDIHYCSLRIGTELILHNVHIFPIGEYVRNIRLCFIACKHSTIELKLFSEIYFPEVLKKSIIIKKDVSQYNSIDVIYKIYIMEWLKNYIYPKECVNFNELLNSLSKKILYYSGFTTYHRHDSVNEILYHENNCDVALKRYSLPYFINIETILTNPFINNFLYNKLNFLFLDYQAYEFTQEEIDIPNSWIVGLLGGTSTGQFRIYDKKNFMYIHIEDYVNSENYNPISLYHFKGLVLIKKFKVCLNFLNKDLQVQSSFSSESSSQSSQKNSLNDIFKMNNDIVSTKKLILIKFFSNNIYLDENDYAILNYFKIYISVSLNDIYFLNDKVNLNSSLSLFKSDNYMTYYQYLCNNFSYKIPNFVTQFVNNIKNFFSRSNESIIRDNDNILIFKIFHKSPVYFLKQYPKSNFVSKLFGLAITLQKCFSIPNFSQNDPKYLPFYKVSKVEEKIIQLFSQNVLNIYPFLLNNKYYKINGAFLNIEKGESILLDKPSIEEVDLFIYKRVYNSSKFDLSMFTSKATSRKIEDIFPSSIHNPFIIFEPLIPKEYHHLLINNKSDKDNIKYISVKDLLCEDNNINSLYNLQCTKYISLLNGMDKHYLNLIPFHLHIKNYPLLMNVSDVLKKNFKNSYDESNKKSNNIISFIGIIIGIHLSHNDNDAFYNVNKTELLDKIIDFEKKIFLKNIGLGNRSAMIIIEVRDFYTPDIIKVFLDLNNIEYPFGLHVGNIIRFDQVFLTSSINYPEPNIYCYNKRNTKITCYSGSQDNMNTLIKLISFPSDQKKYCQPVLSSEKISKILLKNLDRKYFINLYDISVPFSYYSKFICEICEILEINFVHKCRFCYSVMYNGICPNQNQHSFSSNIKIDNPNRKRKCNSDHEHEPYLENDKSDFQKRCEYCYCGVIEASVKCIIEDGTAVANLEVNNVDAIYNLLRIKDSISYISRNDFEKYICHRGNICLYKDSRTNKIEVEKFNITNENSYIIDTTYEKEMYNKIQGLLTMPSLLRQIVVYGKRVGYYNNMYINKVQCENNNKKKVKRNNNLIDKIIEKYEVQTFKIKNNNINITKKIAKKVNINIYSIFVEEVNYSELIFEMINNTI